MRKIELAMIAAIRAGYNWAEGNTAVTIEENDAGRAVYSVRLHGNLIAQGNVGCPPAMTDTCGWETRTTHSRLKALAMI